MIGPSRWSARSPVTSVVGVLVVVCGGPLDMGMNPNAGDAVIVVTGW